MNNEVATHEATDSPGVPATAGPGTASGVDWAAVRARFPAVEGCTYLNTASRGLLPDVARDAGCEYYESMYADAAVGLGGHWTRRLESARATAAGFIGATPDCLAFLANASAGLNLLADLLADDGEVLLHRDEFPSVSFPWLQRGRPVRFLEPDASGAISLDTLEAAIGPDTKTLAVSAVQYASGFAADLPALGALCRAHGLKLICDATQAVGAIGIDVGTFAPDGMVFSAYKWLCAGYGVAGLYVAPEHLHRHRPNAGWRSAADPYGLSNDHIEQAPEAYAFELGNPVMPGPLIMEASMMLLNGIGMDAVEARGRELTSRLRTGLKDLGLVIRSPQAPGASGPITMVEHPDMAALVARLGEQGVHVSPRQGLVRISPHLYNDENDIDRLLEALAN